MSKTISLVGTKWKCIVENMETYGMFCTVIRGSIDPKTNGENLVEIQYANGTYDRIRVRQFLTRFFQVDAKSHSLRIPRRFNAQHVAQTTRS